MSGMCGISEMSCPFGAIGSLAHLTQGDALRLRRVALPWASLFNAVGVKTIQKRLVSGIWTSLFNAVGVKTVRKRLVSRHRD